MAFPKRFRPKICCFPGCGTVFDPVQTTQRYCGLLHRRPCAVKDCENYVEGRTESSMKLLCRSCSRTRGVEEFRKTSIERFGVDHPSKHRAVQKARENTFLSRYGVENPSQIAEAKRKKRDTVLAHYGVENPSQSEAVKLKKKATTLATLGVENPLQDSEVRKKASIALERRLRDSKTKSSRISATNRRWAEIIAKEFGLEVSFERRVQEWSFDLSIVDTDICIEINPTFSHSSLRSYHCGRRGCGTPCERHPNSAIAKDYHRSRALVALEKSIDLIQIYDWDREDSILKLLDHRLRGKPEIIPEDRSYSLDKELNYLIALGPTLELTLEPIHPTWSRTGEISSGVQNDTELIAAGYLPVWTAGSALPINSTIG